MTDLKLIVRYRDLAFCVLGCSAVVMPIDHPSPLVSNKTWAYTTKVLSITWTPLGPKFETLNTVYVPADDTEELAKESERGRQDRKLRV